MEVKNILNNKKEIFGQLRFLACHCNLYHTAISPEFKIFQLLDLLGPKTEEDMKKPKSEKVRIRVAINPFIQW